MPRIWKRVKDCALCGSPRCVVRVDREDMGYCFRDSTTFFVKEGGRIVTSKETHRKCFEREEGLGGEKSFTKDVSPSNN